MCSFHAIFLGGNLQKRNANWSGGNYAMPVPISVRGELMTNEQIEDCNKVGEMKTHKLRLD